MTVPALLLAALTLLACKKDEEPVYLQFNGENDTLTILVGEAELLPEVTAELTSSTEEVLVGTVSVDPGGGPIGTEHAMVVVIDDLYEHIVDRVSVRLDAGDRGEDEFELQQDSADEGVWKLTLVSVGEEGEVREDTLTVNCWDLEDDDDSDEETTTEGDTQ